MPRAKTNEGKVMKNIHLLPSVLKKLNIIAAQNDTTSKNLIEELCNERAKGK